MTDVKLEALIMSKSMLEEALEVERINHDDEGIAYFEFWILVYESRTEDREKELERRN